MLSRKHFCCFCCSASSCTLMHVSTLSLPSYLPYIPAHTCTYHCRRLPQSCSSVLWANLIPWSAPVGGLPMTEGSDRPFSVNLFLLSLFSYVAFRIRRGVFWLVSWAEFGECKYYRRLGPVGDGLLSRFPFSRCWWFWNRAASGWAVSLAAWRRQMLVLDRQLSATGGIYLRKKLRLFL